MSKPIYKPTRPYQTDINDEVEKAWQQRSPTPGYSHAVSEQGKVQGIGGGKFEATDKDGKKIEQKYGNAKEAKDALDARQHQDKPQKKS